MPPSSLAGSNCAVFVGISGLDYGIRGLDDLASMTAHTMTGNTLSIAANRLSYVFDLHGPSMAIDTACSSSLVALHQACNSLHLGEASMAMVGGVNVLAHPYPFIGFSKASMLSARGHCHAFDASGDGYVRAEGGAVLLLKPLEQAEADGDHIHAVILASGTNADGGRKTGLTIPSSQGQIELMRSVLERSGISADAVDYIEAHGTGTAIGDPIETLAIGSVYGQARPKSRPLPIGSIKSNLGHLEPASGMAGLAKALLVLMHGEVPPSLHLSTRNPKIDFAELNLSPVSESLKLACEPARPLVVGVNSFGFGGANAHVLLQTYVTPAVIANHASAADLPPFFLSAQNEAALRALAGRYADLLASSDAPEYYDLAYATAYRRERLDKRLGIIPVGSSQLAACLHSFSGGSLPEGLVLEDAPLEDGKVAFIYAGNGAQWAGMGQLLLLESEIFRSVLEDVSRRIELITKFSVIEELQADAASSRLADTAVAQPMLFAIQAALTVMLRELGINANAFAGHSVGEVAAAWAAGALTLDEAVRVICARSEAQALTRGAGRMAAVNLTEAEMLALLHDDSWRDVEIAALNSPGNLTLSGPVSQLESLGSVLQDKGVFFRLLDLDYAFHSRKMESVREKLAQSLHDFAPINSACLALVSTVTGDLVTTQLDAEYWWENIRRPVLFEQAIKRLIELGCRIFVEISPHDILQRYLKESLADVNIKGRVLGSLRRNDDGIDRIQELALRLHLLAGDDTLVRSFPAVGRFVDLPFYPWQRERHWLPSTSEAYRLIERERIHPLLGWQLKEALASWENVLDPRTQPWLADHRVGGATVLPGAAYLEMALAAAHEWFGGETQDIEEIDIVSPIVFDDEHGRSIRLDLNPQDGGFQIRSRQRLTEDAWTLNASGRILGEIVGYVAVEGTSLPMGENSLDQESHYRLASQLGLDYGPAFQGLAASRVAGMMLEGCFKSIESVGQEKDNWLLHPAIVDVCFQSLIDFFKEEIEAGVALPLLPVKVGRLRLLSDEPVTHFQTRMLRSSLRSVMAEFELLAVDGKKVAILENCRFRAASLRKEHQHQPGCWEIRPIVKPGRIDAAATVLPNTRILAQWVTDWFVDEESVLARDAYFGEAQPLMDALVSAFACEAMQSVFVARPAEIHTWLSGCDAGSVSDCRALRWSRDLLVEQSCLVCDGDRWQLVIEGMPPAEEIWRTLLADHPEALQELILIGRAGRGLKAILQQDLNPLVLEADLQLSRQFDTLTDESITYRGSRLAIEQLLVSVVDALPPNRRLRVLEITPGFSEVPRQLSQHVAVDTIDYVLAHQDTTVRDHLQHEYHDDDWVTIAELASSPLSLKAKGSLPECYDVVVLRHFVSGLGDPRTMLSWARERLANGGLLVLAERYPDLSTELLWGKDRLVPPQVWQAELASLGFDDIETCLEPVGEGSRVGAYLMLARRHESVEIEKLPEPGRWALLASDATTMQLAQSLQQAMATQGQIAIIAAIDEQLLAVNAAKTLLAGLQMEFDGAMDQVLLLAGDNRHDDTMLPGFALNLVQALSALDSLPRLGFLTRGGAPVNGLLDAENCNPAHAALWGFGRVVMNEYPDLACRLIDLPTPHGGWTASVAELLLNELLYPDGESEVILQANARHVLRMQKIDISRTQQYWAGDARYQLDFRVPGQLRNLLWLEQAARELKADEIEVRPVATGLNFRDVMYVMGLLPDEAVENGFAGASLGLEFSGIVSRVGHRVDDYVPGDKVMGFGSACFASHVVTRSNAITPKPEEWSFESAATVPTAFFTAYYALRQLANLQRGERVLIHGAAGGVGIAAVQLARHMGAEVFATAGNEEKREFVALLGADYVFDSRSMAFGDQILAATGGEGVDVVLNSLAGEAIRRNLQILRPFGRFLELGKRDFFENTPIGLRPFKNNISYFGIDADQLLVARPELAGRLFREVMSLFRSGVLSPLPVRVFAAERVIDAFRYMQQARQIGKVVVSLEGARIQPQSLLPKVQALNIVPEGSYIVTGGVTGFGFETARWLAQRGAGQVVLLGRRGEATPGATEAMADLQALGAKVLILACDVANRKSLAKALAHPGLLPIKGIFHAAMVIDDALIANLDPQRMSRVLIPKVKGAWNLHELTGSLALDYFMLYSSITTYIGNPGQANYVAANAWLEGLAVLRRSQGLPVTCIGWGPIGDAGYLTRNQSVKDSLESRLGAQPLSAKSALDMLGTALTNNKGNIAIADFQFSALARLLPSAQGPRFSSLQRHAEAGSDSAESLDDFKALIVGKSNEEIRALVLRLVAQEVAQILAVSADRIDPGRSLHDLGLDSLMGVELALGLEKRFGIQIPAMMLNEGPTVERVTARIMERLFSNDQTSEGASDLASVAQTMVTQHDEAVSSELVAATVAEIEMLSRSDTCA